MECLKCRSNGKSVSVGVSGGGDGVVAIMEAESAHTHNFLIQSQEAVCVITKYGGDTTRVTSTTI